MNDKRRITIAAAATAAFLAGLSAMGLASRPASPAPSPPPAAAAHRPATMPRPAPAAVDERAAPGEERGDDE